MKLAAVDGDNNSLSRFTFSAPFSSYGIIIRKY